MLDEHSRCGRRMALIRFDRNKYRTCLKLHFHLEFINWNCCDIKSFSFRPVSSRPVPPAGNQFMYTCDKWRLSYIFDDVVYILQEHVQFK